MRPIQLTMSAFGPYRSKVQVDFSAFGEKGIYLITGDTGAGKTTIFDGIVFALYGEASGEQRDSNMFRSKYAEVDTPTYVEFSFSYRGEIYQIVRNPEYERPAKKGTKMTTEKADATLTYPDGTVVTKTKDVTKAIKELIGLDRNQFTQIAMIAQGDFLKLLLAKTEERSKIFREIFQTKPYQMLQERLKTAAGSLRAEYEELMKRMEQSREGIVCEEDALQGLTMGETITFLEALLVDEKRQQHELEEEIRERDGQLEELQQKIGRGEAIAVSKQEIVKLQGQLQEEVPQVTVLEERWKDADGKTEERKQLGLQIQVEEKQLTSYEAYEQWKTEAHQRKQKFSMLQQQVKDGQKQIQQRKEQIQKCRELLEQQQELDRTVVECAHQEELLQEKKEQVRNVKKLLLRWKEIHTKLRSAQDVYEKLSLESKAVRHRYEELEQQFLDAQAGVLASRLQEGSACPVCGSQLHPHLATIPDHVCTEEELKQLRGKTRDSEEATAKQSRLAGMLQGELDTVYGTIVERAKELFGTLPPQLYEALEERIAELQREDAAVKAWKESLQKEVKQREQNRGILTKAEQALQQEEEQQEHCRTEMQTCQTEFAVLDERLKKLQEGLSYGSRAEAEQHLKSLKKSLQEMEQTLLFAEKQYREAKDAVAAKQAKIHALQEQFSGEEEVLLAQLYEKRDTLQIVRATLQQKKETLGTAIHFNETAFQAIQTKYAQVQDVEERWELLRSLSNTANGTVSGKDKIMLETYVQMSYFDRILSRANTRLMVMSGGQYEFLRRKEASNQRSQSGLELDVIDHYNGSERSVRTLSGGEAFQASLSLALGLSDEIQSSSGGIQLDAMFIDEGFGSLDEDALDKAMHALSGLADGNRLVGIISHVTELKDRIDKQIVVTKQKANGSTIEVRR